MPDTIKAVAGVSGPYEMAAGWEARPLLTRETFEHHSRARSEADARERAARLNLAGVAGRIEQPCLVVAGKRERLVSWEQTKKSDSVRLLHGGISDRGRGPPAALAGSDGAGDSRGASRQSLSLHGLRGDRCCGAGGGARGARRAPRAARR